MPSPSYRVRHTMKRAIPTFAALAAAAAAAAPAAAGPWTMADGKGRVIVTAIYSHAPKIYGPDGNPAPAPDYDQYQIFFQGEYGITDRLTLLAAPSLRRVEVEGGDNTSGLGYTELGARYKLLDQDQFVLSLQGTTLIPGVRRRDNIAQIGSTDTQVDVRVQAGYSFDLGNTPGFASAEGGYRLRGDGQPDEFRLDATVGIKPAARLTLLANAFNTWSNGRGPFGSYRYSNVYAGAVYEVTDTVAVQLGGLATVTGRNALRERGVYIGLWLKF